MNEKATEKAATAAVKPGDGKARMVVIDVGKKQSGKAIRRLRQGRGKLIPKIDAAVKGVQQETGATDALPIIVVVERKRSRGRWIF